MRIRLSVVGCALLAAVSLASVAFAQTSWWRTYGGANTDEGFSVQQTTEGGYIVAGEGDNCAYLIKTDAGGDTLWTRVYSGLELAGGRSVQQTADEGYIIAGFTYAYGGWDDVYLIKTNASGDALWTRTYGGPEGDLGTSVQQTADGGYIIAGRTYSLGVGIPTRSNVYLIKTDANGDAMWMRAFGGADEDVGNAVQQTADSGYIVAGFTYSFGAGRADVYLVKTDAQGDTLWTRTFGGAAYEEGRSVRQTADGGYIITGEGNGGVCLVKTNASGDTLWTRTCGGTDYDVGNSVRQTTDGGYIIAGITYSSEPENNVDAYLIKTDSEGETLWTRTHGGLGHDRGYSVQQASDGGYVMAGWTSSFGAGASDVYLIKTDSLGNVGVLEESPKPRVMRGGLGTTVLSGASGVRRIASCVAFDATGRRVLHPKSGIYFLRIAATAAPRKVLRVR